jgi:hypothetical protein
MTLTIEVPASVEERLAQKAKDAGLDVERYVAQVVQAHASKPSLKELSGSVYRQFLASGMTDQELGELLETAKHEMRAERHVKAGNVG